MTAAGSEERMTAAWVEKRLQLKTRKKVWQLPKRVRMTAAETKERTTAAGAAVKKMTAAAGLKRCLAPSPTRAWFSISRGSSFQYEEEEEEWVRRDECIWWVEWPLGPESRPYNNPPPPHCTTLSLSHQSILHSIHKHTHTHTHRDMFTHMRTYFETIETLYWHPIIAHAHYSKNISTHNYVITIT